ncbi:MAG: alanine racemase [Phycisphaeraceae bacterium]|nr:alanine racemase [Phycisphaeraceae bacterium]
MTSPSRLEITLSDLTRNVRWWKSILEPGCLFGAVVKANAYGLGAAKISECLLGAGADCLLVYSLEEAVELLRAGLTARTLVFMPTDDPLADADARSAVAAGRLQFSADSPAQIEQLRRAARTLGKPIDVHLHLDTGMSRAGLSPEEFRQAIETMIAPDPLLTLSGVYSHLATANDDLDFAREQDRRLADALAPYRQKLPKDLLVHIGSTFVACRDRRFHKSLARIGLGLYGYGPAAVPGPHLAPPAELRHVVRWVSSIVHVQTYAPGATAGYDRTYRIDQPTRLGIVPVGYGLGYPTALGNKSSIRILDAMGQPIGHAPLRGKVNMDQVIIDLTGLPGAGVGATVELISADPASECALPRLAKLVGTHCYEMLCRVSTRVPRVYV